MHGIIESIAKVHDAWTIAAFAIASVLTVLNWFVLGTRGKGRAGANALIWPATIVICVLGIAPIVANAYLENQRNRSIYHVRVLAVDAGDRPLSGAILRTTASNETAVTADGFGVITIPRGSMPADGKVRIYADLSAAFLHGHTDTQLGEDFNPSLRIQLTSDATAIVGGLVEDDHGRALSEATVSVLQGESGQSTKNGLFALKANASKGQSVRLHVEKPGFKPVDQIIQAGSMDTTIVLKQDRSAKPRPGR